MCSPLLHLRSSWKGCSANFRFTEFYEVGPQDRCTYGDLGSGSSQLVQEGSRPPEFLGEYWWVLPYAYAHVVLEAEGSPRREHHAVFFAEPVGELEGGHVELVAQEGEQSFM
jgi:hypothetical protein